MAVGDVYRVVVKTVNLGNEILNRYHYFQDAGSGGAQQLVAAVVALLLPDLLPVMDNSSNVVSIFAENIDDVNDWFENTTGWVGQLTGDPVADFVSLTFALTPVDKLVRAGRKAIAPITESIMDDDTFSAAFALEIANLISSLSADLSVSAAGNFVPGIFSPANASHAFDIFSSLSNVAFNKISTQNSRKI